MDLETADQEASEKAREADIRPDAKEHIRQEGDEPAEAGQGKPDEKEGGKRNPKK